MTLSSATNSRSGIRRGFTLVEMLVVIGIIILLIGILLPAINVAYTHAIRNRMALDIQSISTALEAYKSDMRTYPQLDYTDTTGAETVPPPTPPTFPNIGVMKATYPGSVLLCRCLMGLGTTYQDGAGSTGTGGDSGAPAFRLVPNGQVYGPYLEIGKFKIAPDPALALLVPGDANINVITDRYGHPILYLRCNSGANINVANGYVANVISPTNNAPMWNQADMGTNAVPLQAMCLMLGDNNWKSGVAANGKIDPGETPITIPYILWSAGPDETFGIDISKGTAQTASGMGAEASSVPTCDDVMNFKP